MIVVFDIEECLAEEGVDIPAAAGSPWGKALFGQMNGDTTTVLLVSTSRDREMVKTWLLREQFLHWQELHTRDKFLEEAEDFKVATVSRLIADGKRVGMFVSSDATVAAQMASLGVTQLVVVPGTGKAGQKSVEIPYKTWDHLVTIIDEEKIRKAQMADKRDRHFTEEG